MAPRTRRVEITDRARIVLRRMIEQHGAVLFHQSGVDRDGSAPRCLPIREARIGGADVLLGTLPWHTEFWVGAEQYERWKHAHLTLDVLDGRGCSAETPEDTRFVIKSRLLTDEEAAALADGGPPRTGADRLA
ncbi:DUF779 domain-containing protein [Nocardia sp. NBC_00508]|uniref:DUF779 domain-containing protein n=1 Tax=Nocardia sp. NBC_00508 TaxID=2975992 RepID=UPI002E80B826|nr:DUF779 domain-containing protein [Nocardia sp. NBC_00508]WUD66458.1 DUF779 domain-containing protein [Nocardia sp. NBC_00508]